LIAIYFLQIIFYLGFYGRWI